MKDRLTYLDLSSSTLRGKLGRIIALVGGTRGAQSLTTHGPAGRAVYDKNPTALPSQRSGIFFDEHADTA